MQRMPVATQTFQSLRTTLRPPRAAVVFNGDGDWLSHAAQALYECGRVWGGSGFILIPHHNGLVHPALVRLAAEYDPDYVLTAQVTIGQHEAVYPEALQIKGEDDQLLHGEEREQALRYSLDTVMRDPAAWEARDLIAAACTPHRYVVERENGAEEAREQQQVLRTSSDALASHQPISRAPSTVEDHLPSGVPGNLQGPWGLAAAIHYGLGDPPTLPFANASPPTFETARSLMRRALPSRRGPAIFRDEESAWSSAWTGSESGTVRVQPWQASQKHNLVVVGCSADDFALALGWHVQFGNSYWIPEDPPYAKEVKDLVLWGLGQDMLSEMEYHDREVVLTSAALQHDQVCGIVDSWVERRVSVTTSWVTEDGESISGDDPDEPPTPRVAALDELDFADGRLLVVRDQYDVPLALPASIDEHGQIRLLVDLPPLAPTQSEFDEMPELTWQIDLEIPDVLAPRMRGVSPRILQHGDNARESFVRSSRSGLSCYSASWGFIGAGSTRTQAMARPRLQFPSLLTWTGAMASANSMTVRFSAPGQRVEVLRKLWGGRYALTADWAGALRPVLLAFHSAEKKSSDAFPARDGVVLRTPDAYLSFAAMARLSGALDDDALVDLRDEVDRLCYIGAVQRGLILRCNSCLDLSFATIDDLGSSNRCRRCGTINPLERAAWNSPVSEPTWWYDLHPAARELLAADAGVGLLAADYLRSKSRTYQDVSELEFFRENHPIAEADLIAVADGRIIVAEAKTTPRLGTRREREAKAAKLATIAATVRADELLLCSSSSAPWSDTDIASIESALESTFPDSRPRPSVRTIVGLGSPPSKG